MRAKASLRRRALWYSVLAITMIGAIAVIAEQDKDGPPDPALQSRTADLNRALTLARDVRAQVKNPKSFELERVQVQADGTICMTYRATNSFDAVVPAHAIGQAAKYWVSDDGGDFAQRWKALCAAVHERDETRMVRRFLDG
jgi:hypothetical protein